MGKVAGSAGRGNGGRPADNRRGATGGGATAQLAPAQVPPSASYRKVTFTAGFDTYERTLREQALNAAGNYSSGMQDWTERTATMDDAVSRGVVTRDELRMVRELPVNEGTLFNNRAANATAHLFRTDSGAPIRVYGTPAVALELARIRAVGVGAGSIAYVGPRNGF